jgi:hypothetical protein
VNRNAVRLAEEARETLALLKTADGDEYEAAEDACIDSLLPALCAAVLASDPEDSVALTASEALGELRNAADSTEYADAEDAAIELLKELVERVLGPEPVPGGPVPGGPVELIALGDRSRPSGLALGA